MDASKRAFLRKGMLGALVGVSPTLVLTKVSAQTTTEPATIPSLDDAPLIVNTESGWLGLQRQDGELKAYKAMDPTSTPINQWLTEDNADDGTYQIPGAGQVTIRDGLVAESEVDPMGLTIEWEQHSKVKIGAMEENPFSGGAIELPDTQGAADIMPSGGYVAVGN